MATPNSSYGLSKKCSQKCSQYHTTRAQCIQCVGINRLQEFYSCVTLRTGNATSYVITGVHEAKEVEEKNKNALLVIINVNPALLQSVYIIIMTVPPFPSSAWLGREPCSAPPPIVVASSSAVLPLAYDEPQLLSYAIWGWVGIN